MATAHELDEMNDIDLEAKLREAKEELFNLRFQAATGQLESHGRLRLVKKDIARIYTVVRERELGIRTVPGADNDAGRRCRMSEQAVDQVERTARKVREGLVVSDKMDKTVVVSVEDRVKHALYGKVLRRTSKLKAHDETERVRHRRPGPHHGDPSAVGHQALARRRDRREGQVSPQGHPGPSSHQVRQGSSLARQREPARQPGENR